MTQILLFRCLLGLSLLFPVLGMFPGALVLSWPFSPTLMIAQSSNVPSFEAAIGQTKTLLTAIADGKISNLEFAEQVKTLVQSQNGARGFFVTYLTAEVKIADQPTPELLQALESSPEIVSELLAKNLVMSAATAVLHRRHQDQDLAQGSERVKQRTINLIKRLNLPPMSAKLQALKTTIMTGKGEYQAFIERWDYDHEQKQAMLAAIAATNI